MVFGQRRGVRILLAGLAVGVVCAALGAVAFYLLFMRDLPTLDTIEDYQPAVVTEVVDRKGRLIAEFAVERRRPVAIDEIPEITRLAFVASEDGAFFEHKGLDYASILRAAIAVVMAGGERVQGASTITQQMVKTLLLTPEKTYTRKIREAILALRVERNLTKDEILYLYLNQIYFGTGAYGIGEAARTYFNKGVQELSISESALLAGLPQRPSQYSPFRNPELAEKRRRYVLGRMLDDEMLTEAQYEAELAEPPELAEPELDHFEAAAYFTELVRRYLYERFGGERVLRGGLRVETSLDIDLQMVAVAALRAGLQAHDHRQGFRGPLRHVKPDEMEVEIAALGEANELPQLPLPLPLDDVELDPDAQLADPAEDASSPAEETEELPEEDAELAMGQGGDDEAASFESVPFDTPYEGVVVAVDEPEQTARIALAPEVEGIVHLTDVSWAREPNPNTRGAPVESIARVFEVGDVAKFVRIPEPDEEGEEGDADPAEAEESQAPVDGEQLPAVPPRLSLHQEPLVQGSLLSIENHTGDVLSLVGGYDYEASEFDRVTQARRQPGSAFKPFIYGAAVSKGYTPVTQLIDRPVVYEDPITGWKYKPRNYGRKFYGPISMRRALAKSVNNATVHLFRDVGVDYVIDYARRFGIESPLNRDLSLALGSSEVTLLELTRAYAIFPNGGKRVIPRYITRVTDGEGEVLLEDVPLGEAPPPVLKPFADEDPEDPAANLEPYPDGEIMPTDRVVTEAEAFLMTDLLKAVVNEGTGGGVRQLGGYLGGKTGTTNEQADAWFLGFSSEVTTGVWVGHDQVRALGFGETGAGAALPIWRDYMREAIERYPVRDFSAPEGIVSVRVDPETGLLAGAAMAKAYFQPFLEGTEPTERAADRSTQADAERLLRSDAF
jgi:penicillin-binding protein 1A